ncbi:hypothetical protein [Methanopyrus sp.]
MRHLPLIVLIMFFATAVPAVAAGTAPGGTATGAPGQVLPPKSEKKRIALKPPSDLYERWRKELRETFPYFYPHYDAWTHGDVKLTGTKVCCVCKVTTRQRLEIQPGVEVEGVLVVTSTESGADVWFVNWNGWAHKLRSLRDEVPTGAAYAPSDDGGIVLFATPGDNSVVLHAFRLSFTKLEVMGIQIKGGEKAPEAEVRTLDLCVPRLEPGGKEVIRTPGKVDQVRVLHVGYDSSGTSEKPLFLVLYTVNVPGKPTEEYGTDLYSALVRVDPKTLGLEVVPGAVITDFQHVTAFDAEVVELPHEYITQYCEYQLGDHRKVTAYWVAVAYAKRWEGSGIYLDILGYSPVGDVYVPIAHAKLSDDALSPPVENLLLAQVPVDDMVVFLTAWTDGRDPISSLKSLLNPSPTGELIFDGVVIWCQPAVLKLSGHPEISANVRNKPAAIVPEGSKPASLVGVGTTTVPAGTGQETVAVFWLDVIGEKGIRSFPIPVAVERGGEEVTATPCVFAVTVTARAELGESVGSVVWVFGVNPWVDPKLWDKVRNPMFVPNVMLPIQDFTDEVWKPWASTLTVVASGVKSVVAVRTGEALSERVKSLIPTSGGVIGGTTVVVYQTEEGVFVLPSLPIVCGQPPMVIGEYPTLVPLRYRMLKVTVNVSGPTSASRGEELVYRVELQADGVDLQTVTTTGCSVMVMVGYRSEVTGVAVTGLLRIENGRLAVENQQGAVRKVEVKVEPESALPVVDVWVRPEDTGVYTVEAFFADSLGQMTGGGASVMTLVTGGTGPQPQAPSPRPPGYIPPGPGVLTSSKKRPGIALPVPIPVRGIRRRLKGP